ncbi:MAG: PhoPQ-activated pathogenicity [Candidatus Hydrogenedentes bacterium]|nr:PhoPQ-activated pathogenicity [Candidatus Hydrogenedentota bacterium]
MFNQLLRQRAVRYVVPVLVALALAGCATTPAYRPPTVAAGEKTALDRYVAAPDPNYSYKVVNTIKGEGYTGYIVDMVSQQYLTEKEVDKPLWQHYLMIIKPDNLKHSTALLYIGGGNNNKPAPEKIDEGFAKMAVMTQSVCAMLPTVPSEPLVFADDNGRKRTEDEIIAYTWDKYMRTGDEKWPLRLPMTKSAVRAMDTITAVCALPETGGAKVDTFMVAGGSKRGWTTWTTAAVDKRVIAITPFVINMLNVVPSFEHHYKVYGFWAPAVGDYQEMGIMNWTGTPEYAALMKIEEPFSYRNRYTIPKFIVNACGDEFFLPDSTQYYFTQLPGENYLRNVPNAKHSLGGTDARESMLAFYSSILNGTPRPKFSWKLQKDGSIKVTCKDKPSSVKLWQATNPNARDFRVDTIGDSAWTSTDLTEKSNGVYVGDVPKPEKGFTAYMVEMTFPSSGFIPFKFTTDVRVKPDIEPFELPTPETPKGFIASKQASK